MENQYPMIPTKAELSGIRKYLTEFIIVTLCAVVAYLFVQFNDLNKYIRDEFLKYGVDFQNSLDANTRALDRFNNKQYFLSPQNKNNYEKDYR